jgi:hypothetical protein
MALVNELLFLTGIADLAAVIALARDETFFAFLFAVRALTKRLRRL